MPLIDLNGQAERRNATEMLLQMQRFQLDLKFSVALADLSTEATRFHDAYRDSLTIPERMEIIGDLRDQGVVGIEALYPNEINEDNLDIFKRHAKETGQRVISVSPNLHYQRLFEFGSLSNPDANVRRMAIDRLIKAMRLNRELDTDFCLVWPGVDGYENSFAINFLAWRDRISDALSEAMEAVPGVRIALEPKPSDPRGRQYIASPGDALVMCARVESRLHSEEQLTLHREGHALMTVCMKASHITMAHADLADELSKAMEQGRLAHTKWNSQPPGSSSQELNVGVANPEQTKAGLYCLKMYGYTGLFGLDINPVRMNPLRALQNSIDAMRIANERIEMMDHEHILECSANPAVDRGWIEAYLTRKRAPNPDNLHPLAPPIRGDDHRVE